MTDLTTFGLVLVRPDDGDGSWKLVAPEGRDAAGKRMVVLSGAARWVGTPNGYWNRPDQHDYDVAMREWTRLLEEEEEEQPRQQRQPRPRGGVRRRERFGR